MPPRGREKRQEPQRQQLRIKHRHDSPPHNLLTRVKPQVAEVRYPEPPGIEGLQLRKTRPRQVLPGQRQLRPPLLHPIKRGTGRPDLTPLPDRSLGK